MQFTNFIQIAGVHDLDEARLMATAGADAIGLPLRLDVHAPDLSEEAARQLVAACPIPAVAITYLTDAALIAGFCRYLGVAAVQLHAPVAPLALQTLRRIAPGLTIIKSLVVRPGEEAALERERQALEPWVDAWITDTFDPATGASGATGKTHDWAVSRALRETTARPLILAGGLRPENVAAGILATAPAGVDTHTGVEGSDGRKSPERLSAFIRAARDAFSGGPSPGATANSQATP